MSDHLITRLIASHLPDQVQWSHDGGVYLIGHTELVYLKPKQTGEDTTFTDYRFSGTLMNIENRLISVLCDNEVIRAGQTKKHIIGQQNESQLLELCLSDSGVSSSGEVVMTAVTDSMNGYVLRELNGDLQLLCLLNEYIAKLEGIDLGFVLRVDQLAKLRIHTTAWTGAVGRERLRAPIWPIFAESLFVVFTESPETWFYRVVGDRVERVVSFDTGLTDEYVRKCKFSNWMEEEKGGDLVAYLMMLTTSERVVIQKVSCSGETLTLTSLSEFHFGKVSTADFHVIGPKLTILTVVSTNKVTCIAFTPEGVQGQRESTLYDTYVQCNSLAQYTTVRKEDQHVILHTVVANTLGDIVTLKVDIPARDSFAAAGPVSGSKYNYRRRITAAQSPLVDKLNETGKVNKYKVCSLSVDPSGRFLGVVTSLFDPAQPIDGRIVSHREDVSFSVVELDEYEEHTFNSVQYSPSVRTQMAAFAGVQLPEVARATVRDVALRAGASPEQSIQEAVVLSADSEAVRVYNVGHLSSVDRANRHQLAQLVVKLVEGGHISATSAYDELLLQQYLKFVGKEPSGKLIGLRVEEVNMEETFSVGPHHDTSECLASVQEHPWKVCGLTLVPLLSPRVRVCQFCGSRVLDDQQSYGEITDLVLRSVRICIDCGGRYKRR